MVLDEDVLRAAIIFLAVILIAAILIYLFFFAVVIKGFVEEGDEEGEFCRLSHVFYKDGKWIVDGGDWFNENAVLSLRFGAAFIVLFENFELLLKVSGNKCGVVKGTVSQNAKLLRRRIRRI